MAFDALRSLLIMKSKKDTPLRSVIASPIETRIKTAKGKSIRGPVVVPVFHPAAYLRAKKDDPLNSLTEYSFSNALRVMAETAGIPLVDRLPNHPILDQPGPAKELLKFLRTVKRISVDVETSPRDTGLLRSYPNPHDDVVIMISFCWGRGKAATIPLKKQIHRLGDPLQNWFSASDQVDIEILLKELMEDDRVAKFGHNFIPFDTPVIQNNFNCAVLGIEDDTMILKHQVDQTLGNGLKEICVHVTPFGDYERPLENAKKGKPKGSTYAALPYEILFRYAGIDAEAAWWVREHYLERLQLFDEQNPDPGLKNDPEFGFQQGSPKRWGAEGFYRKVAVPVAARLANHMMATGIAVDLDRAKGICKKYGDEIKELDLKFLASPEIREAVGIVNAKKRANDKQIELDLGLVSTYDDPSQFNVRSQQYAHALFFDVLKLPVVSRSKKTGMPSAGKGAVEIWEKISPHPLIQLLCDIRKLRSYVDYIEMQIIQNVMNSHDGRLHTSYNVCGTDTGRWSSSNPNLQNIPSRGKRADEIQSIFVAAPGYVLIKEDIKQAEFRLFGVYSGDPILKQDVRTDFDCHSYFASQAYGVSIEEVLADKAAKGVMRANAKNAVFATLYGAMPAKIAETLRIPIELAEKLQTSMWERYKVAHDWVYGQRSLNDDKKIVGGVRNFAREHGFVRSLHSRVRVFSEPDPLAATNSPVQAAAFDENCTKGVTVLTNFERRGLDARLCLNIHDCIASEVRQDQWREGVEIHQKSRGAISQYLDIPFPTDLEVGFSLSDVMPPEEFAQQLAA